ncbi:MAG: family 16 glycoside hydrolase [Limisphaerales bacterium]
MLRLILTAATLVSFSFAAQAAELRFDFGKYDLGSSPTGFVSVAAASGKPGVWKIVEDEMPSAFAPLSPNATTANKRRVLAQTSQDPTDEHFPLFIYDKEVFGDFTVTTRFKCISGEVAQMAGVVFRYVDEKNFYVLRASAKGNTFRFYKVVNGLRSNPLGPEIPIPAGTWHELTVSCKGNQIRCSLNGKEAIPMLTDNSFTAGKIGFFTKSDSVSFFADTVIDYVPREPVAQKAVKAVMDRYPRLLGLKIVAFDQSQHLRVVASNDPGEIGQAGTDTDANVIKFDQFYTARGKETVTVYSPVRDRNGEPIGSLVVRMKSFAGQTENNALARVLPISREISARIKQAKDLFE